MDLAAAVAPTTLARQRTLPVADPLRPLLPEGGLVRGRVVACRGVAATSLTLALAAEATRAGAWLAVVDVPWLGVEAAAELGVPLERLVRIEPGADRWTLRGVGRSRGRRARRVRARRHPGAAAGQRRRAAPGAVAGPGPRGACCWPSATPARSRPTWRWRRRRRCGRASSDGAGHLRGRRVTVVSSGRRIPRPRRAELWLPGPDGVVAAVGSSATEPVLRSVG